MQDKDKLVYQIISGKTRISIKGEVFFVNGVNAQQRYLAEEIFEELYEQYLDELMSDDELMDWLLENDFWTVEEEEKLGQFRKDIEEFQVKLFELGFKGEEKKTTKKLIIHARDRINELTEKKHHWDHLSARGVALIEKNKFLIGLGLTNDKGIPLLNEFNYLEHSFPLFDKIVIEYNKKAIGVSQFREISRTEPWRQYWGAKEASSSIFGGPASELTDDQLSLISWTRLYDSIYQHPECPGDDVINDDDALDGFLIKDRRKREADQNKARVEDAISNPKIKSAQEVFIVAETPEDAKKINDLNDDSVKAVKRRRDALIDKQGKVKEADLPDVKKRLQLEINAAKFKKG